MQEPVPIDGWRESVHIFGTRLRAWRQCARRDVVLALTALGTLRGLGQRFMFRCFGNAARRGVTEESRYLCRRRPRIRSCLTCQPECDIVMNSFRYRLKVLMPRTLINLAPEDKQWLDAEARARGVSMASLVREAVHEYRVHEQAARHPTLGQALADTAGIWRGGDGLAWQRRLRDEWAREN